VRLLFGSLIFFITFVLSNLKQYNIMTTLIFKNKGRFADELSSRYEAIVDDKFIVRVFKDSYMKGFRFSFYSINGYELDAFNSDCLSCFWDKATKQQAVKFATKIVNNKESYNDILKLSSTIEHMMISFK